MKFKLKNILMISFLAIAGLFSISSVIASKQAEKASNIEKAEASYNLGTLGKNVFFHNRNNWNGARLVLEGFNWINYQEAGGKTWDNFVSCSVVGSNDDVYVAAPTGQNKESVKILKVSQDGSANYGYIEAYGNLRDYPTTANVFESTSTAHDNTKGSAQLKSTNYNLYYVTLAGPNASTVTMNKVDSTTNTLSKGQSKPCYCTEKYVLTATAPNGYIFTGWTITGTGSASYVSGYTSSSNPTRITSITDDITVTANYVNPWTSTTMQYKLGSSGTWTNMSRGTQDGCLAKFYTSSAITQTANQDLYLRYTYSGTTTEVNASNMSLVGGEGYNNFALVSSRPTFRLSNITGYIDVRVTNDGTNHFYCWAKGVNDDNGKDCDYGRFDFVINGTRFENATHGTGSRVKPDEWYISNIKLNKGDTVKFVKVYTSGGSDYGTIYNAAFLATSEGANGFSIVDGVATADYTGDYQLYIVWGGTGYDCLYCNRLTRNVTYDSHAVSGQTVSNLPNPSVVTTGGRIASAPTSPTSTGYTFGGWYQNQACTEAFVFNASTGTQVNDDMTVYAKWTANTYTISYSLNGGSSGESAPTGGTYNTAFGVSKPTKEGYTFTGWQVSTGTGYYGSTSVGCTNEINSTSTKYGDSYATCYFKNLRSTSGTVTLTATWSINSYAVTISAGAGIENVYLSTSSTATSGSESETSYTYGTTVYGFVVLNDGYGWNSSWSEHTLISGTADSEGAIYRIGSITVNTSSNDFGEIDAESGETGAISYATAFNTAIGGICKKDGSTDFATLKTNWNGTQEVNYNNLRNHQKYYIKNVDEDSDANIKAMIAKYNYVLGRYGYGEGDSNLHDFLGNKPAKFAINNFKPYYLLNDSEEGLPTVIIIVSSSIALLSITALSVLVIKKRKRKEE